MARPLRIQYKNAYYHVTCRGNGRQNIFLSDRDRKKFLELLQRSIEIYQVRLLAYVLMTNHFHLIVKTPRANLQEFMRHFNISYTSYFNKHHTRSGHLYQGRYKSFLIDADSYLLQVSRYLHLNPIHTSRFKELSPEEKKKYLDTYPWSSYPDYTSSPRSVFLSPDEILAHFKGSESYRNFVEEGITESINPFDSAKGRNILGDASFIRRILKIIEPSREQPIRQLIAQVAPDNILSAVGKLYQLPPSDIPTHKGEARTIAMEFLYRHGGMNQREIGELMGIDYSTVSINRKRLSQSMAKDAPLRKRFQKLEAVLSRIKI